MAKNEKTTPADQKETCPRCGKSDFAVAKDKSNKHYCQTKGCGHVWVPGNEAMKRPDVVLKFTQEENRKLQTEVDRLRKENLDLKTKLEALSPSTEADKDEIFS